MGRYFYGRSESVVPQIIWNGSDANSRGQMKGNIYIHIYSQWSINKLWIWSSLGVGFEEGYGQL